MGKYITLKSKKLGIEPFKIYVRDALEEKRIRSSFNQGLKKRR